MVKVIMEGQQLTAKSKQARKRALQNIKKDFENF
jgi:hypothetical protein